MSPEAPSTLVVAVLGMGVVFVFLVFLSAMMAALTAAFGRRNTSQDAREEPAPEPAGAGGLGWIAAATAAYLAAERDAEQTVAGMPPAAGMPAAGMPSAAAWRPYDTVEAARWRLRMPASTTVPRQAAS